MPELVTTSNRVGTLEETPLNRLDTIGSKNDMLQEESKDSGVKLVSPANRSSQYSNSMQQRLIDKSMVYRYNRNAIFSIDGERYPAQRI